MIFEILTLINIYLLLMEFEVHTVSHGPSVFFPLIYGLRTCAQVIDQREKWRVRNLQYKVRE